MLWEYFVVLAGQRTGSNFLQANLNEYPGLTCHGELFNGSFIGAPGGESGFGVTLEERERDPMALIARMRDQTAGLAGFRLFHDHDPRVLSAVLADPRVAKIVLSRNPLESYVSLKIARETQQWRLGDLRDARAARIAFDEGEFARHLDETHAFHERIVHALKTSGQTAFFLTYEDVSRIEVMNGLVRFLGLPGERDKTSGRTKKQNPDRLEDKVLNFDAMEAALARIDPFGLGRDPVFEPPRGAGVGGYLTGATAPLLFMPVRGGPSRAVARWLAALDGVRPEALGRDLTPKTARQWLRARPGHRIFTVLRHPVARLYDAFCRHIGPGASEPYEGVRDTLQRSYGLPIPEAAGDGARDRDAHRAAFAGFARFIAGNLQGQSSIRVDGAWASQTAILQGMAQFAPPDLVLREDDLSAALPALAATIGRKGPAWAPEAEPWPVALADIHDAEIEGLVRAAYPRDYTIFGFADWAPA